MLETNIRRIEKRIQKIASFNSTPGKGCTRLSYSPEYRRALDFITQECKGLGLNVSIDGIGNLKCKLAGSVLNAPSILSGSHLDTVLFGGNFDGVIGVIGALEVMNVLIEKQIPIKNSFELIVFVEEEGASFGSTMVGSKTLAGRYKTDDLKKLLNENGVSVFDAAKKFGLNPEGIEEEVIKKGQYKAMLEMHIEQSLVLESRSISIGIVQAIAGIKQFVIKLKGVPNHAGATPMSLRNDPLCGASKLISSIEQFAKYEAYESTVATVGKIQCYPNVPNVIPGEVTISVDVRDVKGEGINKIEALLKEKFEEVITQYGLTGEMSLVGETEPIQLSEKIISKIEKEAQKASVSYLKMNSGAVHDSCLLAELTDVGMIFVPSIDGRSHVPEENTKIEDIKNGCDILLQTIIALAI